MKYFKNLLYVFLFIFIQIMLYSTIFSLSKNNGISYLLSYLLMSTYFVIKNKNDLKKDLKNISFDKKYLTFSLILTVLSIVLHLIFSFYLKIDATNQTENVKMLLDNKIIMGLNLIIFAPICEEFIYRYQFKDNNNFKAFIIYTLIFTLIHLIGSKSITELIYFLPYLFMSISISLQYYKNNNIFTSILYHIFNNLVNIVLLLF